MAWETDIKSVESKRDEHGEIKNITVAVKRSCNDYNSFQYIDYEIVFSVDDGTAFVRRVVGDDIKYSDDGCVQIKHLGAMMTAAEDAVFEIPDVHGVETIEETIDDYRLDR